MSDALPGIDPNVDLLMALTEITAGAIAVRDQCQAEGNDKVAHLCDLVVQTMIFALRAACGSPRPDPMDEPDD